MSVKKKDNIVYTNRVEQSLYTYTGFSEQVAHNFWATACIVYAAQRRKRNWNVLRQFLEMKKQRQRETTVLKIATIVGRNTNEQ